LPQSETPTAEVEVSGVADNPALPPAVLGAAFRPGPGWGRLWPYLDLAYFERFSGSRVQPFVIREDPGDPTGFVRAWEAPRRRPAMHQGYALQWFAFALIVLGVYAGLSLSRSKRPEPAEAA
jgi:surfeit locus 1 family protein